MTGAKHKTLNLVSLTTRDIFVRIKIPPSDNLSYKACVRRARRDLYIYLWAEGWFSRDLGICQSKWQKVQIASRRIRRKFSVWAVSIAFKAPYQSCCNWDQKVKELPLKEGSRSMMNFKHDLETCHYLWTHFYHVFKLPSPKNEPRSHFNNQPSIRLVSASLTFWTVDLSHLKQFQSICWDWWSALAWL